MKTTVQPTRLEETRQETKGPKKESTEEIKGASFMSGFGEETHGSNYESYDTQFEKFKGSLPGHETKGFRYDAPIDDVIRHAKTHSGPIVLHSASGNKQNIQALINAGIDPKRITVAENYNPDPKFMKEIGRAHV